jgi:hypothetical protein
MPLISPCSLVANPSKQGIVADRRWALNIAFAVGTVASGFAAQGLSAAFGIDRNRSYFGSFSNLWLSLWVAY